MLNFIYFFFQNIFSSLSKNVLKFQENIIKNEIKYIKKNLKNSDLSNAELVGCNLSSSSLNKSIFFNTTLVGANLQEADLRGSRFNSAYLAQLDLVGVKVHRIDFFEHLKQQQCIGVDDLNYEYKVNPTPHYESWDNEKKSPYYLIQKRK